MPTPRLWKCRLGIRLITAPKSAISHSRDSGMLSVTVSKASTGILATGTVGGVSQMLFKAVGKALTKEASGLRDDVRRHVDSQMSVQRKGFLKSFRARSEERRVG